MPMCPYCSREMNEEKADLESLRKVVRGFQIAQGHGAMKDKVWVRSFFQANCRAAKKLLLLLGSWEDAVDCIQDTYEKIQAWKEEAKPSLEKIYTQHALEWKKNKMERMG